MRERENKARIGIVGTGFIARGLSYSLRGDPQLEISRVLTRRDKGSELSLEIGVNSEQITNSVQELIDTSDLIVECSGDPVYATKMLKPVVDAGIPIVTMDSELQITAGSYFAKRGFITEAEGDQPGSIAALYKDVLAMGFKPLVLGNIKGFLNHAPTEEEMLYWAKRSGTSLSQVTAFTDGTKIQIEQALVANGLGAQIARRGLVGIKCENYIDGAQDLAKIADECKIIISDYVLSSKSPAGVFITVTHSSEQAPYLRYYKLGDGPYYVLTRSFHLCYLEISKTIRQVLDNKTVLLNNGINPSVSVATIAKREIMPGEVIKRGIGGFDVRGEAVQMAEYSGHLPIGLVFDVVAKRRIETGQMISFDDVEIPESDALIAWQETSSKN